MPRVTLILASILLLFWIAAVDAQPPGRGRGLPGRRSPTNSLAFLTVIPEVAQELGLTGAQHELLEALHADLRGQRIRLFRSIRRPRASENRDQLQEVRQSIRTIEQQGDELVALILQPKQLERLKQLRLQREGFAALERDEFARALKVTDQQREEIRKLRAAYASEEDRTREGRRAARQKLEASILSALTDEQKQAWDEMKGPRFDFPDWLSRLDRRGPRGPGREPRPDQ